MSSHGLVGDVISRLASGDDRACLVDVTEGGGDISVCRGLFGGSLVVRI